MHDEELVPLGPLDVQRPSPNITANIAELSGYLQDLEVIHECERDFSLLFHLPNNVECPIVVQVPQSLLLAHPLERPLRLYVLCHLLQLVVY